PRSAAFRSPPPGTARSCKGSSPAEPSRFGAIPSLPRSPVRRVRSSRATATRPELSLGGHAGVRSVHALHLNEALQLLYREPVAETARGIDAHLLAGPQPIRFRPRLAPDLAVV